MYNNHQHSWPCCGRRVPHQLSLPKLHEDIVNPNKKVEWTCDELIHVTNCIWDFHLEIRIWSSVSSIQSNQNWKVLIPYDAFSCCPWYASLFASPPITETWCTTRSYNMCARHSPVIVRAFAASKLSTWCTNTRVTGIRALVINTLLIFFSRKIHAGWRCECFANNSLSLSVGPPICQMLPLTPNLARQRKSCESLKQSARPCFLNHRVKALKSLPYMAQLNLLEGF